MENQTRQTCPPLPLHTLSALPPHLLPSLTCPCPPAASFAREPWPPPPPWQGASSSHRASLSMALGWAREGCCPPRWGSGSGWRPGWRRRWHSRAAHTHAGRERGRQRREGGLRVVSQTIKTKQSGGVYICRMATISIRSPSN